MYPIALDLHGRLVVVVGGGAIAARKVRNLCEAGARVRVVAPAVESALADAAATAAIELRLRPYASGDLAGAILAYAATDRPDVNAVVARDARAAGVLVDDTSGTVPSDFSTPLAHRVGDVTFAVDTGGSSPSFAKRLLEEVRERFDARYGRAAETLRRARDYTKLVVPAEHRRAVMTVLAAREIDELAAMNPSIVENDVEEAYERLVAPPEAPPPEPTTSLSCATRASALAMWQTKHVGSLLARAGLASTIVPISTKGDRVTDRSLAALGTDSIFVKELELALRDGRADYAVHSCKDLPSSLPDDMTLAAIGPREDPRDAFCSERYASLDALPAGALVGTSSPRRRAQLQALRPDLRFDIIRGNVDTRLRKLREGEFDAILLANAGLRRLGLRATYTVPIDPEVLIPAVGQGALAIETRASDTELATRLHGLLADPHTELAVRAERAYLRTLRGGCQAPVGAHATYDGTTLALRAVIASIDGSRLVRGAISLPVDTAEEAETHAHALATRMLGEGGADILDAVADDAARDPGAAPLAGRLLLLPRTQDRASTIAPAFRGAGAVVVEAAGSDEATGALGARDPHALLFPSSGSVRAVDAYLAGLLARGVRPVVATMGGASSAAAVAAGFPPDVVATEPTIAAFVQGVTHYLMARRA